MSAPKGVIRAMRRRRFARHLTAFLLVAVSISRWDAARAQDRSVRIVRPAQGARGARRPILQSRNEFTLRAPADRVAAIAARHGLTVIRPLDEHAHDVFLVSGPSRFGTRFD